MSEEPVPQTPAEPAPAPGPSIEDTMTAVYDRVNPEEPEPTKAAPETATETPAETKPTPDRDPATGRFLPAKTETTETPAEEGAKAEPKPETPQGLEPPASWSAGAKGQWAKMDPGLQREVLKRELDWQKADGERATKLKGYESLERVLEPRRHLLATHYGSVENALQTLLSSWEFASQKPAEFIKYFAHQAGVDLGSFGTPADGPADPHIAALQQRLDETTATLNSIVTGGREAQTRALQADIDAFAADAKNEFFADVKRDMAQLISAGAAANLRDAYDKAIWANPQVRAKIQAKEEAKRKEEADKRAAEARRVVGTNLTSRGAWGQAPKGRTFEETMQQVYDRLNT